MDTLYTEVAGTTCYVGGERGIVTGLHREVRWGLVGAFVKLDERDVMLYVTLGLACGDRGAWHEVASAREIDRDEFDRINTLDVLRREMGWAA